MQKKTADEEFADRVRRASGNLDGHYVLNARSPSLIGLGWNLLFDCLQGVKPMLTILFFLVFMVFGQLYAEFRLSSVVSHEVETAWTPIGAHRF